MTLDKIYFSFFSIAHNEYLDSSIMPRLFCFHMVRSRNTLKEQSLVIILMTKVLESDSTFYDMICSAETSIKGDKKCIHLFCIVNHAKDKELRATTFYK